MKDINFENLKFIDRYGLDKEGISDLLAENGSFFKSDQTIYFEEGDNYINVEYNISVDGDVNYQRESYSSPSYTDVNITNIYIEITSIDINGEIVENKGYISDILDSKIKLDLI